MRVLITMHIKIFIMILISLFCMCLGVEKALFIKNNIIYFNDGSNLEIQPFIKYPQVDTIGLTLPLNTTEEVLIIG